MIRFSTPRSVTRTFLCLTTAIALSACAGGEPPMHGAGPGTTFQGNEQGVISSTKTTDPALLYGEKREGFSAVERLYNANPDDPLLAARYAKVLRESGDIKKSKTILDKLTKKKDAPSLAFTEMAALYLETGNFDGSESSARKAIKADSSNYRAWHILGIALDAQQKHPEAQTAFEKALSMWKGDAVPVMNNLALNLAAQGQTDKALEMLYAAKKKDPDRVEIERNIRIIRTLNEPAEYTPKPRG